MTTTTPHRCRETASPGRGVAPPPAWVGRQPGARADPLFPVPGDHMPIRAGRAAQPPGRGSAAGCPTRSASGSGTRNLQIPRSGQPASGRRPERGTPSRQGWAATGHPASTRHGRVPGSTAPARPHEGGGRAAKGPHPAQSCRLAAWGPYLPAAVPRFPAGRPHPHTSGSCSPPAGGAPQDPIPSAGRDESPAPSGAAGRPAAPSIPAGRPAHTLPSPRPAGDGR